MSNGGGGGGPQRDALLIKAPAIERSYLRLAQTPSYNLNPLENMVKVTANGITLAESSSTIVVEGNHYFPHDALVDKSSVFGPSSTR